MFIQILSYNNFYSQKPGLIDIFPSQTKPYLFDNNTLTLFVARSIMVLDNAPI